MPKYDFSRWVVPASQTIAAVLAAASFAFWAATYFQTKQDAIEDKKEMHEKFLRAEVRTNNLETRIDAFNKTINDTAQDVSYIRGLLEPRPSKK